MIDHTPIFGYPIAPWHWWFAWHPVFTWDGRLAWLRRVKRRRIQKHEYLTGGPESWFEYEIDWGYCE